MPAVERGVKPQVDQATVIFVRDFVVAPLVERFTDRFVAIERVLENGMSALRQDLRDSLAQNAATMRTIQDPETGFLSRIEAALIQKIEDEKHRQLDLDMTAANKRIDNIIKIAFAVASVLGAIAGFAASSAAQFVAAYIGRGGHI